MIDNTLTPGALNGQSIGTVNWTGSNLPVVSVISGTTYAGNGSSTGLHQLNAVFAPSATNKATLTGNIFIPFSGTASKQLQLHLIDAPSSSTWLGGFTIMLPAHTPYTGESVIKLENNDIDVAVATVTLTGNTPHGFIWSSDGINQTLTLGTLVLTGAITPTSVVSATQFSVTGGAPLGISPLLSEAVLKLSRT